VFCEARRIWSHLLLLGLWERLPNLVPPPCTRAGPPQVIYGATMQPCRAEHPVRRYHLTVHELSIAAPRVLQQPVSARGSPRHSLQCSPDNGRGSALRRKDHAFDSATGIVFGDAATRRSFVAECGHIVKGHARRGSPPSLIIIFPRLLWLPGGTAISTISLRRLVHNAG
jgi:hypothetical protein